jgi:hypoxanthine phosphoribosyltransferase
VFLDKKGRREVDIDADFVGFSIDNELVVGYGLDYENMYRS